MRSESSNVEAGKGEHCTRDTAVLGESHSMAVDEPNKKSNHRHTPLRESNDHANATQREQRIRGQVRHDLFERPLRVEMEMETHKNREMIGTNLLDSIRFSFLACGRPPESVAP